ncbi:MFS transporter [Paroceanicella profunda]|uniref:MFS transporter n=1 Tax=Paroceanicella profunda TaxID=2579971 RepID=A0A5B8G2H7_9RHOB|nr:MFS transporter [Paroceanicella profunda]
MKLAVAETLLYAGVYYIFPALLTAWIAEEGWSKTGLTGAFTLSLATGALCSPLAGRMIDRGHGPAFLGGGALVAGLAMAALTLVNGLTGFYLVWVAAGAAMGFCLYDPCFAIVTRARGPAARRPITLITLVAGFAGTLAFPSATFLAQSFGWRAAVLASAVALCCLAAPLAWSGARGIAASGPAAPPPGTRAPVQGPPRPMLSRPEFWLLATAFSAMTLGHGMVINHLLPMLAERGVPLSDAVLAASMIGPMQVAGRLLMMLTERLTSNRVLAAGCFMALSLASACLLAAARAPALLALFVVLQGSGIGVMSIMKPLVTRDVMGEARFGAVVGALALPALAAGAAAPIAGALLWRIGGNDLLIGCVLALSLTGLASILLATWLSAPQHGRAVS